MAVSLQKFQTYILRWYHHYGRHALPWRQTSDPYRILVSEIMLQQTQVERVIPKYLAFLEKFPTVNSLAKSSLGSVLAQWQGLGYNRRAKYLHQTAQAVCELPGQKFPTSNDALKALPGIGPYTASAIMTFAYNQPVTLIETNIRTIFLYHFFPGEKNVPDANLLPLIEQTIPTTDPKEWYSALMDYGSHLKKVLPNPNRRSKHYARQSKFQGSPRQVRGQIIKALAQHQILSRSQLKNKITGEISYFDTALEQLISEQMVSKHGQSLSLDRSNFKQKQVE